jgi:hypothetical protein
VNKINVDVKERTVQLIESNYELFTEHLKKLRPAQFVLAYLQMLKMVLPKQIDATIDYTRLSDADLNSIVTKILTNNAENRKESES